ncbi:AGE family epimerase/isomerase [Actinosynnema sp. NPDC004786]
MSAVLRGAGGDATTDRELRPAETELRHRVLPFWLGLADREHGGIHGHADADLVVDRAADKGAVRACRYLWTFSAAYRAFGDPSYLAAARHMYRFVTGSLLDAVHGGVFWSVDRTGAPADTDEHVYAQAFALYALSEYHRATGDRDALTRATEVYEVVTGVGFDPARGAYREQFDRAWTAKPNALPAEGRPAEITMNTHLHVLEALTAYHAVVPSPAVSERVAELVGIFRDRRPTCRCAWRRRACGSAATTTDACAWSWCRASPRPADHGVRHAGHPPIGR